MGFGGRMREITIIIKSMEFIEKVKKQIAELTDSLVEYQPEDLDADGQLVHAKIEDALKEIANEVPAYLL